MSTFEKIEICALSNRWINKLSNDTKFSKYLSDTFENTSFTKCEFPFIFFIFYPLFCFAHYLRINLADIMSLLLYWVTYNINILFIVLSNWKLHMKSNYNNFAFYFLPQYLYLEGNHLQCIPYDLFESLPNLRWLDLRSNCLQSLPASVGEHRWVSDRLWSVKETILHRGRNKKEKSKGPPDPCLWNSWGSSLIFKGPKIFFITFL